MKTSSAFASITSGDSIGVGGLVMAIAIAWPTLLSSSAFAQVLGGAAVPRNTPDYRTEGHTPSKFKVLYTFTGGADGGVPAAGLVFDTSGNAYGTTLYGGDLNCSLNPGGGCGTVFKLDPSGKETVLYAFTGGADGAAPAGDLLLDKEGNLYGTAAFGGHLTNCANGSGCGTVFKVSQTGKKTTLYRFKGHQYGDGQGPVAGLVIDGAGNLYGTTQFGGRVLGSSGVGIVFKLDPEGKEKVLHVFQKSPDGADPLSRLVLDGAGNLYGTTYFGGANSCDCGTVFKVDKKTGAEAVLYSFTGGNDGGNPQAGIVQDKGGNFFGTTVVGGSQGHGTVFRMDPAAKETVLYNFANTTLDGTFPEASVLLDNAGDLYGTTWIGGYADVGVVFKLSATGKERRLYSFLGADDGGTPIADLVRDAAGNLYGTTSQYGAYGQGTVFEILAAQGSSHRDR